MCFVKPVTYLTMVAVCYDRLLLSVFPYIKLTVRSVCFLVHMLHLYMICLYVLHLYMICLYMLHLYMICLNMLHLYMICLNMLHLYMICLNMLHLYMICLNMLHLYMICLNMLHLYMIAWNIKHQQVGNTAVIFMPMLTGMLTAVTRLNFLQSVILVICSSSYCGWVCFYTSIYSKCTGVYLYTIHSLF